MPTTGLLFVFLNIATTITANIILNIIIMNNTGTYEMCLSLRFYVHQQDHRHDDTWQNSLQDTAGPKCHEIVGWVQAS